MTDKGKLWHAFTHSGKVEDYLKYRGIVGTPRATNGLQEEGSGHGGSQTASDDRRPDSAQL